MLEPLGYIALVRLDVVPDPMAENSARHRLGMAIIAAARPIPTRRVPLASGGGGAGEADGGEREPGGDAAGEQDRPGVQDGAAEHAVEDDPRRGADGEPTTNARARTRARPHA